MKKHWLASFICLAALWVSLHAVAAEKSYGPGVTDSEIKLGQTMPFSGPASALGVTGRTSAAYFKMLNEQGGINGRKVTLISLDDGYSPPKTVEQTRKLVEQEQVLAIAGTVGTPTNASIQRYLNEHKVPQLFIYTGTSRFRDPAGSPWTIPVDLAFPDETRAFAEYVLQVAPDAKIGVLYQNDDYGKDHVNGLRAALGDKADRMIVKAESYEVTDATVDSQVVTLQASGADVLVAAAIPKFTAQMIRKVYNIGWKPLTFIAFPTSSIPLVLQPAGLEKSVGLMTVSFVKFPGDPTWKDDPEMQSYLAFMAKYNSGDNPDDFLAIGGYYGAIATAHVLRQCGDNLSRENVMYQATHLSGLRIPMLLPGITFSTAPDDYRPIKEMQLQRFDGTRWVTVGGLFAAR
jgi:ABC-type branched-subunit amino acid transport system substrate-binding protein